VAKRPSDPTEVIAPSDFPATTPRDLHPTSDIRFVIHELGKLTSSVERLITDVAGHGTKIGEVKDAITFVKGAIWVIGAVVAVVTTITGLILSGKISVAFH
jgi:hypothetical protein